MLNQNAHSKDCVSRILLHYRKLVSRSESPATLRAFAAWLNDALLPYGRSISHQSIKNWSDKRYLPDRFVMKQIATGAQHDGRGDFAQDILAAIEPSKYQPATQLARELLHKK